MEKTCAVCTRSSFRRIILSTMRLRSSKNFFKMAGKDMVDPRNFPQMRRMLTAVPVGPSLQQIWKSSFSITPSLESMKGMLTYIHFVRGWSLFLCNAFLYTEAKLTFPRDIDFLSKEYIIKIEMCQGAMGQATGVLTPDMFVPIEQSQ